MTVDYLEDHHDAKQTALQLVTDGITLLSAEQGPDCTINVHLLGHSTGAYVIREACDDADDAQLLNSSWLVSQIALIGGDVSFRIALPPLHTAHQLLEPARFGAEAVECQTRRHGATSRSRGASQRCTQQSSGCRLLGIFSFTGIKPGGSQAGPKGGDRRLQSFLAHRQRHIYERSLRNPQGRP